MADFSEEIEDAYADIAADGGPIRIHRPATATVSDPDRPWEGSSEDVEPFETFALIFPTGTISMQASNPFGMTAYIPAKGMDFELTAEMLFTDAAGKTWQIASVQPLAPDFVSRILYTCEIVTWQGD